MRALLTARQKQALLAPGNDRARSLGFSLFLFEHARDHLELY
ncbi:hypothetical protein [Mesorhizobium sp.]|nr:hypothetical protein [Mesorhizobium sp.]